MSINLDQKGLSSVVNEYDLFFIDVWGVVHNGINLYKDSLEVLKNLDKLSKTYVLLTNAPRPNKTVINFLNKMGLPKFCSQNVYTSGEASLKYINEHYKFSKFFHLGPPRDFDLFMSFESNKSEEIDAADFILCTGLFEDHMNDLKFYKNLLLKQTKKIMICTNPDLIVNRGEEKELCAGSIAKIFEDIGGIVKYFGKPYSLVYKLSTDIKNKKVLCIGDNLNTDIKGAVKQKYDSLFITSGIHKNENNLDLDSLFKQYNVKAKFNQLYLKW